MVVEMRACLTSGREFVLSLELSIQISDVCQRLRVLIGIGEYCEMMLLQDERTLLQSCELGESGFVQGEVVQVVFTDLAPGAVSMLEDAQLTCWTQWEDALIRLAELGAQASPWTHVIIEQATRWPKYNYPAVNALMQIWADPLECWKQMLIRCRDSDWNSLDSIMSAKGWRWNTTGILAEHGRVERNDDTYEEKVYSAILQTDFSALPRRDVVVLLGSLRHVHCSWKTPGTQVDEEKVPNRIAQAIMKVSYNTLFEKMTPEQWKEFGREFLSDIFNYCKALLHWENNALGNTPMVCIYPIRVLGLIGDATAANVLDKWLEHSQPSLRAAAAKSAGLLIGSVALDGLKRTMQDDAEGMVRCVAARSVKMLSSARQNS